MDQQQQQPQSAGEAAAAAVVPPILFTSSQVANMSATNTNATTYNSITARIIPSTWWAGTTTTSSTPTTTTTISLLTATTVILGYMLLIRLLRYRRRERLERDFAARHGRDRCDRETISLMTVEDAWMIVKELTEQEFPSIFSVSIFFALFKTYGIPTISHLLLSTGQLISLSRASKRATDTAVILGEIVLNPPWSVRREKAIARMNFLHKGYIKAGKISDDDLLYTLSLFALEPCRWVARWDWRDPTELEWAALGTFWRDLGGGGMGIEGVESGKVRFDEGEDGDEEEGKYRDGLAWLKGLDRWSREYEREKMVFAESNEKVARSTLDIGLFNVPWFLRPMAMGFVGGLLEGRLRGAMGIPPPHPIYTTLLSLVMNFRALFVRFLLPPRPKFLRFTLVTEKEDAKTKRYHATRYLAHPWYIRPTVWTRWLGPEALRTRFLWRGVLPGDVDVDVDSTKTTKGKEKGGKKESYGSEGYLIQELGPEGMKGKGGKEMERIGEELRRRRIMREEGERERLGHYDDDDHHHVDVGRGGGGCPMSLWG